MASEKTIVLKGFGQRKEEVANGPITPGHLLEYVTSGTGLGQVRVHSTQGGNANNRFAVEQDFLGKEIGDAYAVSDQVQVEVLFAGCEVNAFLAIGENVVKGDALESNGDGSLRIWTPQQADSNGVMTFGALIYPDRIVGYAMEAVDNRGASDQSRIQVELS